MLYRLMISIPTVVEVNAISEEDAINKCKQDLIYSKQIKPADYIEIKVIEEKK